MPWPGLVTYHRPADSVVRESDATNYARRHYQLVFDELDPGMSLVPWEKLPAGHRAVFVRAMTKLMQGGQDSR